MEQDKLKGRKITLIGGAGFIGHNLALHLHSLGAEVSIVDSLQVNNLASFSATSEDSVTVLYTCEFSTKGSAFSKKLKSLFLFKMQEIIMLFADLFLTFSQPLFSSLRFRTQTDRQRPIPFDHSFLHARKRT